jgi:multicomponent Na+:H+ antiporter subunit C
VETAIILTAGALYAAAFYALLRRSVVRLALGLVLLSHATNLSLFVSNGVLRARPPLLAPEGTPLALPFSDPLPQAFILTAIVINFGMLALMLVMVHRTEQATGSDDIEALRTEVPPASSPEE